MCLSHICRGQIEVAKQWLSHSSCHTVVVTQWSQSFVCCSRPNNTTFVTQWLWYSCYYNGSSHIGSLMTVVVVRQMSNCPKALRFVIYYADYGAERCFSHVIQVFILISFFRYCKCNPKKCQNKELCKTDNDCGEDGKCKWQMVARPNNFGFGGILPLMPQPQQ